MKATAKYGFVHPLVPFSRDIVGHWAVLWVAAICVAIAVAIRGTAATARSGVPMPLRRIPEPTARYVSVAGPSAADRLPESMKNAVGADLERIDLSFRPAPPPPLPVERLFAPLDAIPDEPAGMGAAPDIKSEDE